MSRLGPVAEAARRGAMRLVPTARRDWAEAVWAEAHEVPAGWPRLAWRAGGVRLIAKEGQMARRTGTLCIALAWILVFCAPLAAAEPAPAKVRPGASPRRGRGVAAPVVP